MGDTRLTDLGTVAFDLAVMREVIELDPVRVGHIDASRWIQLVPDVYRDDAEYACSKVFHERRNTPVNDELLRNEIIPELQVAALESMEMGRRRQEHVDALVREFDAQPPPVDLDDLDAVVEELHHYLEGGRDHLAVPLVRKLLRHHRGR